MPESAFFPRAVPFSELPHRGLVSRTQVLRFFRGVAGLAVRVTTLLTLRTDPWSPTRTPLSVPNLNLKTHLLSLVHGLRGSPMNTAPSERLAFVPPDCL